MDRSLCRSKVKLNNNVKTGHSNIETKNSVSYEKNLITIYELEETLGRSKNQKATGQDGLDA